MLSFRWCIKKIFGEVGLHLVLNLYLIEVIQHGQLPSFEDVLGHINQTVVRADLQEFQAHCGTFIRKKIYEE